jgi:hypothetical protein
MWCGVAHDGLLGVREQLCELVRRRGRRRSVVLSAQDEHGPVDVARLRGQSSSPSRRLGEVAQDVGTVDDDVLLDELLHQRAFGIRNVKRVLVGEQLTCIRSGLHRRLTRPGVRHLPAEVLRFESLELALIRRSAPGSATVPMSAYAADASTLRRERIEPREPDRPVQAGIAVKRDERPARSALVDMELDVADGNPRLEIL